MKTPNQFLNLESQEISLDKWGTQLMENILLTAAEAVAERTERSDSIEVTLKFRLTPLISKDQLEVRVAFERDPTLVTHISRQFDQGNERAKSRESSLR
jgi:hypothetical protein